MIKIFLLMTITLFSVSCMDEKKEVTPKAQEAQIQQGQVDQESSVSGIAEENDMCICTKDYKPVCGKNGETYPNPCQAGCENVEVAHDGPCEDR